MSGANGHFGHSGHFGHGVIPLDARPVEAFPVDVLPKWLSRWVNEESLSTQTPVDLPAMTTLGVLATACAKKYRIHIRPGWFEPLNLFVAVAQPPAERKSAVFRDAARPIVDFEKSHHAEWANEYTLKSSVYEAAEQRRKNAVAAKAKTKPDKRDEAQRELQSAVEELSGLSQPVFPRLMADDVTPEKLIRLMEDQGGRIGIFSAEGGIFSTLAGRYHDGIPVFDVVLKGHSGDTILLDRVKHEQPTRISDPALSIVLTVQPGVVRDMAETRQFRERGLIARFLYAVPSSMVGRRNVNPPPMSMDTQFAYDRAITRLLSVPEKRDDNGEIISTSLKLSDKAHAALVEFMADIEPRMKPKGDLGPIRDWAGKLAGAVARIAGLLHMADHASSKSIPRQVKSQTVKRAVRIGEYLIGHAHAAYNLLDGGHTGEARRVLRWIERESVERFSKRECWRALRGHLRKADDLDDPLKLLIDHGYIESDPAERTGSGRPSTRFVVNPHGQNGQNGQNGRRR